MDNLPNINDQLNRRDLFDIFKKQLAKDFEQSNFPADFIGTLDPDYNLLHQKLVSQLKSSGSKTDSNLMHLLYRIDISEGQLKKYLSEAKSENQFDIIAELIIKRVLQKVVIKQYYKSKEDP